MAMETDYLVVGAGASRLAFTDALTAEADCEVTIVDRRAAVGGHWVDACPCSDRASDGQVDPGQA